jgi:hypothetical protein
MTDYDRMVKPNPYTGLNGRGYSEGVYDQVAVKALVTETVVRALPDPFALVFLDFWYDASDGSNAMLRITVRNGLTNEDRTDDVNVPDNGFEPWAGMVGPTIVAWVKATYGG